MIETKISKSLKPTMLWLIHRYFIHWAIAVINVCKIRKRSNPTDFLYNKFLMHNRMVIFTSHFCIFINITSEIPGSMSSSTSTIKADLGTINTYLMKWRVAQQSLVITLMRYILPRMLLFN